MLSLSVGLNAFLFLAVVALVWRWRSASVVYSEMENRVYYMLRVERRLNLGRVDSAGLEAYILRLENENTKLMYAVCLKKWEDGRE